MAFTFDWSATGNELIITRLRSEIGDDVEDQGVRPNGGNFEDEAILSFYSDEGGDEGKTAARLCEVLARQWARVPKTKVGNVLDVDPAEVSANWAREGERLRVIHGHSSDFPRFVVAQATRATADS